MKALIIVALASGLFISHQAAAADDPLDAAKSLYLAASYQEALSALENLPPGADLDAADKYRALCLLGLDRTAEAEIALESIVDRRPLYVLDQRESPKLLAMFQAIRERKLPEAARTLFASAKAAYDKKEMSSASTQFATLQTLLAAPEIANRTELADLKLLADGFATLARQQVPAVRPPAPQNQPAAERPKAMATVPPPPSRIFGSEDRDVIPPAPIDQEIPRWDPPNAGFARVAFSGSIELVIDEQGAVTSATITRSINAVYDPRILAAASHWRYRPALRDGKPVKYRKVIPVTLRPTGSRGDSDAATGSTD